MKLIDKTPLQNEEGEIGIVQRLQGTIQFGLRWYPEVQAQKAVLPFFSQGLGKGFTIIRNHTLGASGIVIPLAIVGPAGIYVAHVTHLRGTYEAKEDSWGAIYGTNFKPDAVNLLTRTQLLARALQAFIERQGVDLPQPIEPVLLAANPGMHIESLRPVIRVIQLDGIERWVASLAGARPVLTPEAAHELADRIINPRLPKKEESEPDIELAEDGKKLGVPPELRESSPAVPVPAQEDSRRRILGMTIPQLALLVGMVLVEICVLIGFAITIFLSL
jgi:hypothetical protein